MWSVGVVPYLNAVPLAHTLRERLRVVEAVPSVLAARLDAGDLDAALVPVVEALGGVGGGWLGRHGITSDGPVASVLLFLRAPLEHARTVLLDPASRTSAALARVLVREAAGPRVRFRTADAPGPDPRGRQEDVVLVIGDPALAYRRAWSGPVLDLGEAWAARTGLPFVYARWTAREDLDGLARARLADLLGAAAEEGIARRDELAAAWAEARGEPPEAARGYLRHNVGWRIGPREEEGLARFSALLEREAPRVAGGARHA